MVDTEIDLVFLFLCTEQLTARSTEHLSLYTLAAARHFLSGVFDFFKNLFSTSSLPLLPWSPANSSSIKWQKRLILLHFFSHFSSMEHFMQFLFPHYIFLVLFEDPCDTTTGFTAEDFLACYKTAGQRRKKNICFAKYLLNALHPCMFHVIALKKSAALKNANMHFWHLNTIFNVRSKMQWG